MSVHLGPLLLLVLLLQKEPKAQLLLDWLKTTKGCSCSQWMLIQRRGSPVQGGEV